MLARIKDATLVVASLGVVGLSIALVATFLAAVVR